MRKPDASQLSELQRIWNGGNSRVAEFLTAALVDADKALRDGEGAELNRRQGEARAISQLIAHCNGDSSVRTLVSNKTI